MRPQWDTPLRYTILVFLLILVIATLWYVREIFQPLITAASDRLFSQPGDKFFGGSISVKKKDCGKPGLLFIVGVFIGLLVSAVPLL